MALSYQKNLSPNVTVNIIDENNNATPAIGTTVALAGFTPQGVSDEPTYISSIQEFENIFGIPETASEAYTHNAVKQLVQNSPANVLFTRMPYGSGAGLGYAETYSAIVFPVIGVSAVEVNPCDYYRNVDETNCKVNFPWLSQYFTASSITYGSSNMTCSLNSSDEDAGKLYIVNDPVDYDSIWTGFKFVVDSDSSAEDLRLYQLRPTVSGYDTNFSVVTSIDLSAIFVAKDENQANLSNDSKRLIVDISTSPYARAFNITSGLLSGSTLSGIGLSAGDVWGTFSQSGAATLKYFNTNSDVANAYKTSLTNFAQLSTGRTFSVTTSALDASTIDLLIDFSAIPIEAGLSCSTITSLNLQVPDEDKYNFYPITGDGQLNDADFYVFGQPISKALSESEYQLFKNDQFNWKCGVYENVEANLDVVNNDIRAGIVIINENKSAQLEDFSGYYVTMNDNLNVNPATDFNSITGVAGYYQETCPGVSGEWISVPSDRWNFDVSAIFGGNAGSISEIIENSAGVDFSTSSYNDSVTINLFKLRPTRLTDTINKLEARKVETFVGSFNNDRKINDQFGGPPRSFFIEDVINNGSNYLSVKVNPYLAKNNCWNDNSGVPQKTVRMFREKTAIVFDNFDAETQLAAYGDSLYGIGSYNGHCRDAMYELCQKKDIGNLPAKLERALRGIENPSDFPIDITVEAGLGTIWATRYAVAGDHCITDPSICYNYDDSYFVDTSSLSPFDGTTMTSNLQTAWVTVFNIFDTFSRTTRKSAGGTEHYHIADPLRHIFVNGKDYKIETRHKKLYIDPTTGQPSDKYKDYSRNIWSYLKNLTSGVNSPFAEMDADWIKVYDSNLDRYIWVGPSAHKAALYARNDAKKFPWTAPFGYENGALADVIDIANNPNQRERDLLARIGLNPIIKFDAGGYGLWNSLTLQKADSSLKENYIVRGALWLAKSAQQILKQYIGQPNNIITRRRVENDLNALCSYMKQNSGLEDYKVVCNAANNTAETVKQGVLNASVYPKFIRATKFINVDINIDREQVGASINF